jgi:cellulose biosynthesis protein BcsQ
MKTSVKTISFASGKGGVGKTLFAANLARLASTQLRCVLLDFDFQNQGSSGLLSRFLRPRCVNAFDLLSGSTLELDKLIFINAQFAFIPAFDPNKTERFALQQNPMFVSLGLRSVHSTFENLLMPERFDLIIADCHGGLDDISFATFIESDCTLIITEVDKVTFNGTLELIDYYWTRARELNSQDASPVMNNAKIEERLLDVSQNKIRIVVNRVSGKYGFDSLINILSEQLYENLPELREMNEGFTFFPFDPIVAESFSEYPFFVELLPEAIFSQKLELLHHDIFDTSPIIRGRGILFKYFEKLSPKKLRRRLTSAYEDRVRTVFTFTALMQILLIVGTAAIITMGVAGDLDKSDPVVPFSDIVPKFPGPVFAGTLLGSLFCLYMVRFYNRIIGYYRDRSRYEIRLWKRRARFTSMVFILKIITLYTFRTVPRFLEIFVGFYFVFFIILSAVSLYRWMSGAG